MRPYRLTRTGCLWALTTAVAVAQTVSAPTDKPVPSAPLNGYAERLSPSLPKGVAPPALATDAGPMPEVDMFVGESRVFPAPGVGRIAVGNGAILTAAALDGKEVILFANGAGTSSLFIWNDDGRYQRLKINITAGDVARFARDIAAFLQGIPGARSSIIGDKVIVEGEGLADTDLARIELLAKRYPQVINFTHPQGFEQMVAMDVKVVEFPVSELRELGLRWSAMGGVAVGGVWSPVRTGQGGPYQINPVTGANNPVPITSPNGSTNGMPVPGGLNLMGVLNMGLSATLNAMAQQGRSTLLAEPQLSTRNGAKASFLAGGEYPYVVSTINGPTVQFKQYGVKLDIEPRVDRHGRVRAKIDTEVSNIDNSVVTSAGPALQSRKTSTEFNVMAGETIVLSGLLQRESSGSVDKVPGLGDMPVIGALFRSRRFQNKETELVVFVTPTVIEANDPAQQARLGHVQQRLQSGLQEPAGKTGP